MKFILRGLMFEIIVSVLSDYIARSNIESHSKPFS